MVSVKSKWSIVKEVATTPVAGTYLSLCRILAGPETVNMLRAGCGEEETCREDHKQGGQEAH